MSRLECLAQEFARMNLQLKHDMEQAEAKVARVNGLIQELGQTGLLSPEPLLGPFMEQNYDASTGPHDSGLVVQAALVIPEGFGVCLWDSEEFARCRLEPEGLASNARNKFQAFDHCRTVEKAFLLPFIEEMLEELMEIALVADSRLEPEPAISADDYFRNRSVE